MAEIEECEDQCFSRYPRLVKLDQNKKLMPVEELKALAKKMFEREKYGDKSYLENFLSDVMTTASKNQRSSLSLQDAESNIQYFLQRNGVVPRSEITGVETETPSQLQTTVLQAALQRIQAASTNIPLANKADRPHSHSKSNTTNSEGVIALLKQHLRTMADVGLGEKGNDDKEPYRVPSSVKKYVEYFNIQQKRLADAILIIVKELDTLNDEKQLPTLGALNIVIRELETLVQSTQQSYCPQPGILFSPLDLIVGSMYVGFEAWQILAKTRKKAIVRDTIPPQIGLLSLGMPQDALNIDMGAFAASQVFLQAVKNLSEKEINPANNPLLSPLEYLKILYSMLNNIQQKGQNAYLLEYCEALKEAITKEGPTGAQPLPTLISTDGSERAELSTKVITVDGSPVTILEDTHVVAPNPVEWHGRILKTKQDWIGALEGLGTEQKWSPVGTPVNPTKLLQKMSHSNPSHPNQRRNNARGSGFRVNVARVQNSVKKAQLTDVGTEKLNKAIKLLLIGPKKGQGPKSRKRSIDKLINLKESQRKALTTHGKVKFREDQNGKYRFDTRNATPLSNGLIESKDVSAELLAAYMLVTYSYPSDIAEDVESKHNLTPKQEAKTYATRQGADDGSESDSSKSDKSRGTKSSSKSSSGDRVKKAKKPNQNRTTTRSRSPSPDEYTVSKDRRHAIIEGRVYVPLDDDDSAGSASSLSDDTNIASGRSDSDDSDESNFDRDSGSSKSASKAKHRKAKRKKKKSGSGN